MKSLTLNCRLVVQKTGVGAPSACGELAARRQAGTAIASTAALRDVLCGVVHVYAACAAPSQISCLLRWLPGKSLDRQHIVHRKRGRPTCRVAPHSATVEMQPPHPDACSCPMHHCNVLIITNECSLRCWLDGLCCRTLCELCLTDSPIAFQAVSFQAMTCAHPRSVATYLPFPAHLLPTYPTPRCAAVGCCCMLLLLVRLLLPW